MGDKTFNQVEIKLEITLRHSTLYKTTMVLSLHRQGIASYVIYITMTYSYSHKNEALQRLRQHTYKTNNAKFVIKGKACALKKMKNNCHSYKAYVAKFQQRRKKIKTKAT